MRVEKDFLDLLKLFNKHKVKYCIVGAFAVGFHAIPRYTKDMDILVEPGFENGKRIIEALDEFGFGSLRLTEEDFAKTGQIIQLGYEPVRVDLITSISGCNFSNAWKHKCAGKYGDEKVFFIGLKELIKSKSKTGRKHDEADLEVLKQDLRKKI